MKKRILTLIAILLGFQLVGYGQTEEIMGKVAPQTANFVRYGDVPTSLYEGKVHLNIPIYEIPDKDFPFNISLNYTSDGFKPFTLGGLVGMDWGLSAGGVVTREVYGAPDDHQGVEDSSKAVEKGFWTAIQAGIVYDKDAVYNQTIQSTSNYTYDLPLINGCYHDYQPDLFQFKFGSHKGAFVIGNDGTVLCNNPGFRIDLSGLCLQRLEQPNGDSQITITTPDGYQWTFGGTIDALEYSFSYSPTVMTDLRDIFTYITAWHLTQVEAPNGRVMNLIYEGNGLPEWAQSPKFSTTFFPNEGGTDRLFKASKGAFLKSIQLADNDLSIDFYNTTEETIEGWLTHYQFNHGNYRLDGIQVRYNQEVYKHTLTYEYVRGRRFLQTVTQEGLPPYRFSYHHANYPDFTGSLKIVDMWGYWSSNYNIAGTGQLKKVVYPTKGYSTFTYEDNTYGNRVETKFHSFEIVYPKPQLKTINGKAGGSRIKEVIHYSSDAKVASSVEYLYVKNYSPGIISTHRSGTLLQYQQYYIDEMDREVFLLSNSWMKNYNIGEPHIGYQEVVELYNDGSYTINEFTAYQFNEDIPEMKLGYISSPRENKIFLALEGVNIMTSSSYLRGKLANRIMHNADGKEIKRNYYGYKHVNSSYSLIMPSTDPVSIIEPPLDYVVTMRPFSGGAVSRKITLPHCPIKVELEGNGAEHPELLKLYTYNAKGFLKEEKLLNSLSDTLKTCYEYTEEMPNSGIYSTMREKNMLNSVVNKRNYKNNTLLNRQEYKYDIYNGKIGLKEKLLHVGSSVKQLAAYKYDASFNIKEIVSGGLTTTYIWSYKGLYPVAKIEGKSAAEVEQALGTYNCTKLLGNPTDMELMAIFNALRTALPDALITSYTYNPLKGITSITDPKGFTTEYSYDPCGRLQEMFFTNNGWQRCVIESYKYNYANQ